MKPIIFNTDMVRAILEGRKTVTRRAVKGAGQLWGFDGMETNPAMTKTRKNGEEYPVDMPGLWATFESEGYPEYPMVKAPYQPGDILYVRETWCRQPSDEFPFVYRASVQTPDAWRGMWKPSIHMPKEAARIFLRVMDVRVERLQEMTEEDVFSEGAGELCECPREHTVYYPGGSMEACFNADCCNGEFCPKFKSYPELFGEIVWDSTIKPADRDKYSWTANPWVWAIKFEWISREEAAKDEITTRTKT